MRLKSLGAGNSNCNFPTDSCEFPMEEIIDAQKLKFSPRFLQNGGFPAPNLVFLKENLRTIKFFNSLKFTGEQLPMGGLGSCPLLPRRHWSVVEVILIIIIMTPTISNAP